MYKWNPSVDEVSLLNLKLQNQKQSLYIQGEKKLQDFRHDWTKRIQGSTQFLKRILFFELCSFFGYLTDSIRYLIYFNRYLTDSILSLTDYMEYLTAYD